MRSWEAITLNSFTENPRKTLITHFNQHAFTASLGRICSSIFNQNFLLKWLSDNSVYMLQLDELGNLGF